MWEKRMKKITHVDATVLPTLKRRQTESFELSRDIKWSASLWDKGLNQHWWQCYDTYEWEWARVRSAR